MLKETIEFIVLYHRNFRAFLGLFIISVQFWTRDWVLACTFGLGPGSSRVLPACLQLWCT